MLAIAWSPHHHGLLASGGGTADRCIRFWNTLTGQPMQCVDTGSQVCNLAWSKHSSELVTAIIYFHTIVTSLIEHYDKCSYSSVVATLQSCNPPDRIAKSLVIHCIYKLPYLIIFLSHYHHTTAAAPFLSLLVAIDLARFVGLHAVVISGVVCI